MGMLFALLARRGERGASAVEYGLLVVGVAAALFLVVPLLGDTVRIIFESNPGLECEHCASP